MKIIKQLIAVTVALQILSSFPVYRAFADELSDNSSNMAYDTSVDKTIYYLKNEQDEISAWTKNNHDYTSDITNVIEYVYDNTDDLTDEKYELLNSMIVNSADFLWLGDILNTDDLSRYLLVNELQYSYKKELLLSLQNLDGGYGLADGYASDIIDTKLALKTLADLGETEAMTNAAMYIATLQNDDGGFSYQSGLASNAELTAEIADILADCMRENVYISHELSETISKLTEYLEVNAVPVDELSADNLSAVYQNFHTALFELKMNGRYDVTTYFELQNEDGGVFDDPMSTAL